MKQQRKSLNILGVGLFCLATVFWLFIHPSGHAPQQFEHATAGFLYGLSLVCMIAGYRLKARQESPTAGRCG